jgi:cobalt-precorrin 5A hydrolase / precorrin-3B C17-methyltransferase
MVTLVSSPPAIFILSQQSVALGRKLAIAFPTAQLYGLAERTTDVDVQFTDFGATVRQLFQQGTPIIGICAAGILIRTVAPLLQNKWQEPPLLAIAEDGSAVVPLLGGLQGANHLAREIGLHLKIEPAITTTGDIRFRTALLSPPEGYHLAYPEQGKQFLSDLLAGATVKLEGSAPWITESQLPIASNGALTIRVTENIVELRSDELVYHPRTVAIAITTNSIDTISHPIDHDQIATWIEQYLNQQTLAVASIAGVFAWAGTDDPFVAAIAQHLNVPVRSMALSEFEAELQMNASIVEIEDREIARAIATTVTRTSNVIQTEIPEALTTLEQYCVAIAVAPKPINPSAFGTVPVDQSSTYGTVAIVGTGPGGTQWMSPEVKEALWRSQAWVGYKTYLDLVEPLRTSANQRYESDNRVELDRARQGLNLALEGKSVAIVSSGDPGIFAMAAAVFEVIDQADDPQWRPEWRSLSIQVCPGISAMQAAAAQVGAPLGHDFCAISLSDILKPWQVIEQRIAAAAAADFAIAFYNPVSKQRTWQLERAKELLLQWRSPDTPIVLARDVGRPKQTVQVRSLVELAVEDVDMRTIVLVGSSQTRRIERSSGGCWVYTPRRYE